MPLLLETGDPLLLETGDPFLLEWDGVLARTISVFDGTTKPSVETLSVTVNVAVSDSSFGSTENVIRYYIRLHRRSAIVTNPGRLSAQPGRRLTAEPRKRLAPEGWERYS